MNSFLNKATVFVALSFFCILTNASERKETYPGLVLDNHMSFSLGTGGINQVGSYGADVVLNSVHRTRKVLKVFAGFEFADGSFGSEEVSGASWGFKVQREHSAFGKISPLLAFRNGFRWYDEASEVFVGLEMGVSLGIAKRLSLFSIAKLEGFYFQEDDTDETLYGAKIGVSAGLSVLLF